MGFPVWLALNLPGFIRYDGPVWRVRLIGLLSLTLIHFTLIFLPIRRFDPRYHLDLGRNDLSHFSLMLRPITLFTVLRLGTANFKDLFCLVFFHLSSPLYLASFVD